MKISILLDPGPVRALPSALVRQPQGRQARHDRAATFVGRRFAEVGARRVTGSGRRAFHVTHNGCRGRLSAGERCQVYVRFRPRKRGTARATLTLAGGGAAAHVSLSGGGK